MKPPTPPRRQQRGTSGRVRQRAAQADHTAQADVEGPASADATGNADTNGDRSPSTKKVSSRPVGGSFASTHEEELSPARATTRIGTSRVPVLSTGMLDRLQEKEAARDSDRRRKILLTVVFFLVLAALGWVMFFSPIFALTMSEVRVNGAKAFVSEDDIRAVITPHEGTPLARLNMSELGEDIARIPNVAEYVHTRRWPRGLTVSITERVPVAAIPRGDSFSLVDREAIEVDVVEELPDTIPLINIPGEDLDERVLTTALAILEILPETVHEDIAKLTASTQDNVVLTLRDGVRVKWGSAQDSEVKVNVLEVLRPKAQELGKKTIDLSAPNLPIIK